MFGKLMKYEMKSLLRGLLPLYGAVLAVAVVNALLMRLSNSYGMPQAIAAMLYFGLCVAVGVLTVMVMVQRFYKGLLCDEGYLMHTLPVRPWQLVLSKLTGATIMTILSSVVGILSVIVLAGVELSLGDIWMIDWAGGFARLFQAAPTWPLYVVEWLIIGIFYIISWIVQLYAAMGLGHLSSRHRVAMSFVWYMVISTVLSILFSMIVFVGSTTGFDYWLNQVLATANPQLAMHLVSVGVLVYYVGKTAVFFAITNGVISRKLNLE